MEAQFSIGFYDIDPRDLNPSVDSITELDKRMLAGVFDMYTSGYYSYRNFYWNIVAKAVPDNSDWKAINNMRGEAVKTKFILLAPTKEACTKLIIQLRSKRITSLKGYELLNRDKHIVPNALEIEDRVLELPLENNNTRMLYLYNALKDFFTKETT